MDFFLQLKAVDINQPTFTSTAKVNITITDANDHSPEFAMPTVVFNVLETASVLSSVGTVSVSIILVFLFYLVIIVICF